MQRDINFFSVYRSPMDSDHGHDRITIVGLCVVGACLLFVIGAFACSRALNTVSRMQQQTVTQYLNRGDVSSALGALQEGNQKIAVLNEYANAAGSTVSAFQSQPSIDSALLGAVAKAMPADVSVTNIVYDGHSLALTCGSADRLSAADFAHALKGNGTFSSVTYDSVTLNGSLYDFTLTCVLKGVSRK